MPERKWLSRTELLLGASGLDQLEAAHVLVIGLGGVGSFAAEFLARAGVGQLTIVDGDTVEASNRNRQLPALATTEGQAKAAIMAERLCAINPGLKLNVVQEFLMPEMIAGLMQHRYNYVLEAIDSITPKTTVIAEAVKQQLPIVSSMGAGGKMDPTCLKVDDISQTRICPFAQVVRKRLRGMGVNTGVKAVYSVEMVQKDSLMMTDGTRFKKSAYGTISYLPATFGAVCASVVIRDLAPAAAATKSNDEI